jgi:GTP-binding protein YchF
VSVGIGIIGLAGSGRSTIFNVLTGMKTDSAGQAPNIGVTKVPDSRLQALADILHPKRVVLTEVQFTDIGASGGGLGSSRGIGGQLLAELSNVDALIAVVRAFSDESVPHVEGSVDTERDIAAIGLELCISDLAILERRLDRIKESLKGAKPPEHQHLLREQEILLVIKSNLERDVPIRQLTLSPDEARVIAGYQFLTAKPILIAVNIGEEQLPRAASLEEQFGAQYAGLKCGVVAICGKLEMELAQLDEAAAEEFRAEYDLAESGRNRLIRRSYQLLGLISFFTVVSDEVRVWPVTEGTGALRAAGKIHSDMERGFIRAEVIGYDDLVGCGSLAEARKRGLLRLEGKSYVVREGDVVTFLFNV